MNSIRAIPYGLFNGSTAIREMDLYKNRIALIQNGAFRDLANLKYLKLSSNQIPQLVNNTFSVLSSLEELELSSNLIEIIEYHAFTGLISIKIIALSSNNIRRIEWQTFAGFPKLETLYLDNNAIDSIETGAFDGSSRLRELWLQGNNLIIISSGMLSELNYLQILQLSDNQISHLDNTSLNSLIHLKLLNLANNRLASLSAIAMNSLTSLNVLYLDENGLKESTFIQKLRLPKLRQLYLRNNQIRVLGQIVIDELYQLQAIALDGNLIASYDSILSTHNIKKISLSRSKISNHYRQLMNISLTCRKLDLSHNFLYDLPQFNPQDQIKMLNLSYNRIAFLTVKHLSSLTFLELLDLRGNKIASIPTGFFQGLTCQKYLTDINLSGNQLAYLRGDTFSSLSNLKHLRIDSNPIDSKPFLKNVSSLISLTLINNKIKCLNEIVINDLKNLQNLSVRQNFITKLKSALFKSLKNLTLLSLNHNRIASLTFLRFSSLKNLQKISLIDNQIKELDEEDFKSLNGLEAIYLDYNSISSIKDTSFTQLNKLQILSVSHNNIRELICKCRYHQLPEISLKSMFLKYNNIEFISDQCYSLFEILTDELDVSFNKLASNVPEFVDQIFRRDLRLIRLGISGNRITHLWQAYQNGLFRKEIGLDISYNDLPIDEVQRLISNVFPLHSCHRNAINGWYNVFVTPWVFRCWFMYLGLSGLKLQKLPTNSLRNLEGLIYALYLNNNNLTEFDVEDIFYGSDSNMRELQLSSNNLKAITNRQNIRFLKLQLLNISDNDISNFCNNDWQKFAPKLEMIYADRSNIKVLQSRCLQRSLKDNPLTSVHAQSLYGPLNLSTTLTNRDYFCCMVPAKVTTCQPIIIESLSSCQHLLSHLSLRLYIWIAGSMAFVGNILVFCSHWKTSDKDRSKKIFHLLLINLSVADFLMSIYLFIIAIADQFYHNQYGQYSENWLRSTPCLLAFFFGSLSSIMSVLMMLLISIDLRLRTVHPIRYRSRNHKYNSFRTIIILFWLLCIFYVGIATITSTNAAGNDRIYKYSSICMPNNIENAYFKTWILIITFLTVCTWLIICVLYYLVFKKTYRSSASVYRTSVASDRKLARKLSVILLTDLMSWLPYYFIMCKVLFTNSLDIFELKFVIIIALPINSALNPFLYSYNYFITPCICRIAQDGKSMAPHQCSRLPASVRDTNLNRTFTMSHGRYEEYRV
ncbi:G-protein coupled receptor GRL101-like protein [Trichoplax sp. H2]|nr:G-protein coupled receptor GRL101-like protein [Trichoplax sp. H2]|eukprot:RDD40761.1 G-protein coupled receptor GRL101-like protein [Trichoplax sp. H2]